MFKTLICRICSLSLLWLFLNFKIISVLSNENVCYKDFCTGSNIRYLFYDVNPYEGFNLRRDVYLRFSLLAHNLKESKDQRLNSFRLVLPPWSHLVHWGYSEDPEHIPWSTFFDIKSMQRFAPVIDMYEYFETLTNNKYTKAIIDEVYVLQHFEDMFETGKFVEKLEIQRCQNPPKIRLFYYQNITTSNVKCLSFHGPATKLEEMLKTSLVKTVLIDHAEVALHDSFGGKTYWESRRSMRFNKQLRQIASEFREKYLNSTDVTDNTLLEDDWVNDKPKRTAKGGPYLAVHLRRKDFVRSRPNDTPSLDSVAKQIKKLLKLNSLQKVFIATDAPQEEFGVLKSKLIPTFEMYQFIPIADVSKKFHEGGIAIIEQIICSYARYFVGTSESTFSFRIQEEREIIGFPTNTTFNSLCKDNKNCKNPSVWKIVY